MELRLLLLETFLSLVLGVFGGSAACFPPDRLALRQFAAFPLKAPGATPAFVGWEGDDCCSWHGVVCNSDNHTAAARISKLLLPNQNLMGAIPNAICSLSALSTLDLSLNHLTGSIPTCFAHNLTNLQYLDLSKNEYLNGTILPVSALPHLAYLDLSETSLQIMIPPFQAPIAHSLHTLFLNRTSLAAKGTEISELLCGYQSLEKLSMVGNSDHDALLGLKPSNLVGEMPRPANCERPSLNLTFLDLSNNRLTGPFPAWLSLFSHLQVLILSGNNFSSSGGIPPEWQNLTHLTVLQLSGPSSLKPTNSFLLPQPMQNWLFRLPLQILTLTSLGLANQDIPCSQLSLLNATLQSLDFSNNLLTGDHALHCLAHSNFTTLESLDLSQNDLAFNLGLAIPPSLSKALNLASCRLLGELTDQFFAMFRFMTLGHITLGENSLSGSLPLGIGALLDVQLLDLSYNKFTGRIPASLGNITDLSYLDLGNNNLEGEIPPNLGNFTDLFFMNFGNNHLEGEVPGELGYTLNMVFLGNNKLTKWHLPTYNPAILDLSYNRLEGDLEQTFFGNHSVLKSIIVLLLGHNRLSGAIPHTLFNGTIAPCLSIIQLSDNHLTGTIPHSLFKLFPRLTLDVSWLCASFVLEIPERLLKLIVKNMELSYDVRYAYIAYLDLSNNKLNGPIPESFGQLSRLTYLNLSRNQLTGNIPSSLSNLSLLESLDLSYNRLQGSLPSSLSKLTNLEVFNVSFNEELSGPIPTNAPQLEQNTSYIGDLKLCGYPYLQSCADVSPHLEENHEIEERKSLVMMWIDEWIAIPGFCLGIVMGFLGVLWVLRLISFI